MALAGYERSPSSQRAWIEIGKGSGTEDGKRVALLAEGVDRNTPFAGRGSGRGVALLAEGVDRNLLTLLYMSRYPWSPSSQRAWIEIGIAWKSPCGPEVALLAEGVDRNLKITALSRWTKSRPPRRGRG